MVTIYCSVKLAPFSWRGVKTRVKRDSGPVFNARENEMYLNRWGVNETSDQKLTVEHRTQYKDKFLLTAHLVPIFWVNQIIKKF